MESERDAASREPIYLLELEMDECSLLNPAIGAPVDSAQGEDECNAAADCRYTWFNCQDTASYTKGTRTFRFCNRGAKINDAASIVFPLLDPGFSQQPTQINQDKYKTVIAEYKFLLFNTLAQPLSNPDKLEGGYSQTDSGRFWENWIARNETFKNRVAKLYQGYKGVASADFELIFKGVIWNINWNKDGILIIARDILWKTAENKLPYKIPSDIVVEDNPLSAGATTINIDDGSGTYDGTDHFEAATVNQPRVLKIEDEYITYTSLTADSNGTVATGCERGAFGTAAVAHAAGTSIEQVVVYAENDGGTWQDCTGQLADHCLMDLLMFYAEVPLANIKTYDYPITLDGAVAAADTEITLSSVAALPEQGILVINDEVIYYNGFSGNDIVNVKRGMYGTTAASHDSSDDVMVSFVTHALAPHRANLLLKSRFEGEKKIDAKIDTWRQSTLLDVWVNEDGLMDAKMQAPPQDTDYKNLTETTIIHGSKVFNRNEEARATRIYAWGDPYDPDPKVSGKDVEEDYRRMISYVDLEAENTNVYGEKKIKRLYCEWLYRDEDLKWTSGHYWTKYRFGSAKVKCGMELRDTDIRVMDLVSATFPEDVDADGAAKAVYYFITKKIRKAINYIEFWFGEAGFGDVKFSKIGPENGVLDSGIDDTVTTIDVDLSGTDLVFADFRTGGNHQVFIEDEKITYTTTADQGSDVIRLSGGARGVDGTSNVAHSAAVDVRMLYSAASDDHRDIYGFIGSTGDPPDGDLLDGNGDFSETVEGYIMW